MTQRDINLGLSSWELLRPRLSAALWIVASGLGGVRMKLLSASKKEM